jgi:hypothetical protein
MNNFKLDTNTTTKVFTFCSAFAYLKLDRVTLIFENNSSIDWASLVSNMKLKVILRNIVCQGHKIVDERKDEFPLHLQIDPSQVQPVFILNQTIQNKTFTIGLSDKEHFYTDLIFELEDSGNNEEPCSLLFEYEMSDMEEK